MNLLMFPVATNSSKAEVARSNRAGQARFHISSSCFIVFYWLDHCRAWLALEDLGLEWRILDNYGQEGGQ